MTSRCHTTGDVVARTQIYTHFSCFLIPTRHSINLASPDKPLPEHVQTYKAWGNIYIPCCLAPVGGVSIASGATYLVVRLPPAMVKGGMGLEECPQEDTVLLTWGITYVVQPKSGWNAVLKRWFQLTPVHLTNNTVEIRCSSYSWQLSYTVCACIHHHWCCSATWQAWGFASKLSAHTEWLDV